MTFMLGGFASGLSSGIKNGMEMYQTYQKLSALSATSKNIDKAKAEDAAGAGTGTASPRGADAGMYEGMLGEPGPGQGSSTTGSGGSTTLPDITGMPDPRKVTPAVSPSTGGGTQRDNQNPGTYGPAWAPGQGVTTQGGPGQPGPVLNTQTPLVTPDGGNPTAPTTGQPSPVTANVAGQAPGNNRWGPPQPAAPAWSPASTQYLPTYQHPQRPPTGPQVGGAATRPPGQGIYVPGEAAPAPATPPAQRQLQSGPSPQAPTLANPQNTMGQGILTALGAPNVSTGGGI